MQGILDFKHVGCSCIIGWQETTACHLLCIEVHSAIFCQHMVFENNGVVRSNKKLTQLCKRLQQSG